MLITDTLTGRNKQIELRFCPAQKFTILAASPTTVANRCLAEWTTNGAESMVVAVDEKEVSVSIEDHRAWAVHGGA